MPLSIGSCVKLEDEGASFFGIVTAVSGDSLEARSAKDGSLVTLSKQSSVAPIFPAGSAVRNVADGRKGFVYFPSETAFGFSVFWEGEDKEQFVNRGDLAAADDAQPFVFEGMPIKAGSLVTSPNYEGQLFLVIFAQDKLVYCAKAERATADNAAEPLALEVAVFPRDELSVCGCVQRTNPRQKQWRLYGFRHWGKPLSPPSMDEVHAQLPLGASAITGKADFLGMVFDAGSKSYKYIAKPAASLLSESLGDAKKIGGKAVSGFRKFFGRRASAAKTAAGQAASGDVKGVASTAKQETVDVAAEKAKILSEAFAKVLQLDAAGAKDKLVQAAEIEKVVEAASESAASKLVVETVEQALDSVHTLTSLALPACVKVDKNQVLYILSGDKKHRKDVQVSDDGNTLLYKSATSLGDKQQWKAFAVRAAKDAEWVITMPKNKKIADFVPAAAKEESK